MGRGFGLRLSNKLGPNEVFAPPNRIFATGMHKDNQGRILRPPYNAPVDKAKLAPRVGVSKAKTLDHPSLSSMIPEKMEGYHGGLLIPGDRGRKSVNEIERLLERRLRESLGEFSDTPEANMAEGVKLVAAGYSEGRTIAIFSSPTV